TADVDRTEGDAAAFAGRRMPAAQRLRRTYLSSTLSVTEVPRPGDQAEGAPASRTSPSPFRWIMECGLAHRSDIILLWALAGLATATVAVGPVGRLAFRAPTLWATFETGITLCSLIGAWLFGFSFTHTRRLRDLLLLGALVAGA